MLHNRDEHRRTSNVATIQTHTCHNSEWHVLLWPGQIAAAVAISRLLTKPRRHSTKWNTESSTLITTQQDRLR